MRTTGLYLEIGERDEGSTLFLKKQPIIHANYDRHGSKGLDLVVEVAEHLSKVLDMKLYRKSSE